jgi:aspartokinase/homoserine dehydrogenase 1
MKVLKFGGSSIGSPDNILLVLAIIKEKANTKDPISVIFSAYEGITDQLIEIGKLAAQGNESYTVLFKQLKQRHLDTVTELISPKNKNAVISQIKIMLKNLEEILYGVYLVKELTRKTLDYIMSFGERFSAFTISESLIDRKVKNKFIDSRQVIITDDYFGAARVDFKRTNKNIRAALSDQNNVYIITGFIASTPANETTTLGRGGSDFSASIFGAAVSAKEIEIWTDVNGVLTADPKKVPNAFTIMQMTYEEAMELSHFGAKVIHPPTMQPALDKNIPIRIKNTFNPSFEGTLISRKAAPNGHIIRGLSSIDNVSLLQIQGSGMVGAKGIAERIFRALASENINIILISQASSEHSICFGVLPDCAKIAKSVLEKELAYEIHYGRINKPTIEPDMSIIAVVGENMRKTKGIAGRVFQTLGRNGVNISAIAQGSSELNISMVIDRSDEAKALKAIHDTFFMPAKKILNLFIVGTGLIGGTFLEQLKKQEQILVDLYRTSVRVIAVANIKKMIFNSNGLTLDCWKDDLNNSTEKSNFNRFIKKMKALSLPNSVLVDCTVSESIAALYADIFNLSISIVTPNKIANSQSYEQYEQLRSVSRKNSVQFLYETNVGAGLPIIDTIKNMTASGDKIFKIEGILSGTLSYLFNTFDGTVPFSQVVLEAKEKGYTEPDVRQDLNGMDVARKLLILIREAGYPMELSDIKLTSLLPKEARTANSLQKVISILQKYDEDYETRRLNAANEGKVLRYIARYAAGKASISLIGVGVSNPFYSLSGSENIIAVYSEYYRENPLVLKGPGAGASVTAAGVLSDVLRISNWVE